MPPKTMLTRNRNAWIWVTIAALTLASVARAEGGRHGARAGVQFASAFLAIGHSHNSPARSGIPHFVPQNSGRSIAALFRASGIGGWVAILPVFFIGLISPLSSLSAAAFPRSGRAPSAPYLPFSFQRPPPRLA
jgi:hypothetical protein